jgi:hypothetical protein
LVRFAHQFLFDVGADSAWCALSRCGVPHIISRIKMALCSGQTRLFGLGRDIEYKEPVRGNVR